MTKLQSLLPFPQNMLYSSEPIPKQLKYVRPQTLQKSFIKYGRAMWFFLRQHCSRIVTGALTLCFINVLSYSNNASPFCLVYLLPYQLIVKRIDLFQAENSPSEGASEETKSTARVENHKTCGQNLLEKKNSEGYSTVESEHPENVEDVKKPKIKWPKQMMQRAVKHSTIN